MYIIKRITAVFDKGEKKRKGGGKPREEARHSNWAHASHERHYQEDHGAWHGAIFLDFAIFFVVFVFVVEVVIIVIYCGFGFCCCCCCCKCFLLSSPTTLCPEWCCSTPMGSRSRAPLTTQAQCRWRKHLIVVPFQIQFHMFGSVALLYLFKYKYKYNTSTVQVLESSNYWTFSNTITCLDQLVAFAVWRYGDRADRQS